MRLGLKFFVKKSVDDPLKDILSKLKYFFAKLKEFAAKLKISANLFAPDIG